MTYNDFLNRWMNHYVDYDKAYGFQCTDLMRQYVREVYGLAPYTAIPSTGSAANIYKNFKSNKYFKKIDNTPTGLPKKGDIIFWKYYPGLFGWAGHVGIYDSGDMYTIISFDQNYPTGQPCKLVRHGINKWLHGYRGCLGWLRHA
jgi:cell wall-associated NlpC family hydrolase